MKERGKRFMVGLVLAGVILGLLFLNPGLSQAEEWETLVDDTRLTYANGESWHSSLEVDSFGNIHIAWEDCRDGGCVEGEIYYTKLDNNGNTIVEDVRLTYSGRGDPLSLGVDGFGNVHIVWSDWRDGSDEIYYTKLDNNGNTLVDDTRLTFASGGRRCPSLGMDSFGNIHIAWYDTRDGNREIYYTKLDNNGNTVVDDTRLTFTSSDSDQPSLGVDSFGNIHITWSDDRDGSNEIYYTKLDNNGNILIDDTRLTNVSAWSRAPSLGVDSTGNIHIAWQDNRDGNFEIYYTKLDNNGNTLVDDTRLTSDSASSGSPSLGMDSADNIHIAWRDERDGNWEIYYTMLDNNDNTLVDDTRLTSANGDSLEPSLGVDSSGNIHVAWQDDRDGNDEIYYTKGRTIGEEPSLTISADRSSYTTGETMNVSLEIIAGSEPTVTDLYIRVVFPGGAPVYYYPTWTTSPAPVLSSWTVTDWGPAVFFNYTFGGGIPSGEYTWDAALTEPGTANIIDMSAAPFTFSP